MNTMTLVHSIRFAADTSGLTRESLPDFIRKRAYALYELRGSQPGRELEDWLQAECEVKLRFGLSDSVTRGEPRSSLLLVNLNQYKLV
jgi:hypothetical protein